MRIGSAGCVRILLAVSSLVAAACSGAAVQADRYFTLGDYPHAAAAYDASAANAAGGTPSARTLYRLGVARATPGTEAFDPAKAAAAFDELSKRFPSSTYTERAALPIKLLKEFAASTAKLAALQSELDRSKAQLDAALQSSHEERRGLQQDLNERNAQVLQLKARVAEQELAIARLKAEMEQFKRIDLGAQDK